MPHDNPSATIAFARMLGSELRMGNNFYCRPFTIKGLPLESTPLRHHP